MRYELLGSLRVIGPAGPQMLTARKIELLLAVLLVRADHVVSTDQLIGEVWGERAPHRATAGLHVYVSELRKFLARQRPGTETIVTRSPGYLLRQGDDEFDFQDFLALVEVGRGYHAAHRYEEEAEVLQRALGLWRGPLLGEPGDGIIVGSFAAWLAEVRMECTEMLIDVQLELGHHRRLIGRLRQLVADSPLHEAFYRQLMLALYRSDRTADALHAYRQARATLNAELGLEPCRALQELQHAILVGDERVLSARV